MYNFCKARPAQETVELYQAADLCILVKLNLVYEVYTTTKTTGNIFFFIIVRYRGQLLLTSSLIVYVCIYMYSGGGVCICSQMAVL